jgi:hypothetical protein
MTGEWGTGFRRGQISNMFPPALNSLSNFPSWIQKDKKIIFMGAIIHKIWYLPQS